MSTEISGLDVERWIFRKLTEARPIAGPGLDDRIAAKLALEFANDLWHNKIERARTSLVPSPDDEEDFAIVHKGSKKNGRFRCSLAHRWDAPEVQAALARDLARDKEGAK